MKGVSAMVVTVIAVSAIVVGGCGEAVNPGAERAFAEALARTAQGPGRTEVPAAQTWPNAGSSPHRLTIDATIAIVVGEGETHQVRLKRVVDRGAGGAFRVQDSRSVTGPTLGSGMSEGREAVFDGSRFATRRAGGPWIERETMDGGPGQFLRQTYDIAPAILSAFADDLVEKHDPKADERLAGREVRWHALALRPGRVRPAIDGPALAALRDHQHNWVHWLAATHRPTRVEGALARPVKGGEVIAGRAELSGDARVEGVQGRFTLRFAYRIEPAAAGVSFALPDDVMPPRRPRLWERIRRVVGAKLRPPWDRGAR